MDKKHILIAGCILSVTLVCLVVVLALISSMPDLPESIDPDQICIPDINTKSNGEDLICGNIDDLLHEYINKKIENEFIRLKLEEEVKANTSVAGERKVEQKQLLTQNFWELKPAARLTGVPQPDPKPNDFVQHMFPIRAWRHDGDIHSFHGFKQYGMKYRNGRLIVPISGTYNVYSYLDMYEPCEPGTGVPYVGSNNNSIKHAIYKFNIYPGNEVELIANYQPHQISQNKYFNIYSSYVSSVVQLNAGDELTVKVSNMSFLRYPDDNFFGANLI